MMAIPAPVLSLAEDLNAHLPLRLGDLRLTTERYVATLTPGLDPHYCVVQRLRLSPQQVAETVAEVRERLREHGRTSATWEVGPSSQPADLAERLRALGMVPDAREPVAAGLVLRAPPSSPRPASAGLSVRQVESLADFFLGAEVFRTCFATETDDGADADPWQQAARDYARYQATPTWRRFLALRDGRAVAAADASFTDVAVVLSGGATLAAERGTGAYRALVWARWDEAQRRGTPTLVTQAGAMSRPILLRLGFEQVAAVRVLLDRFGAQPGDDPGQAK